MPPKRRTENDSDLKVQSHKDLINNFLRRQDLDWNDSTQRNEFRNLLDAYKRDFPEDAFANDVLDYFDEVSRMISKSTNGVEKRAQSGVTNTILNGIRLMSGKRRKTKGSALVVEQMRTSSVEIEEIIEGSSGAPQVSPTPPERKREGVRGKMTTEESTELLREEGINLSKRAREQKRKDKLESKRKEVSKRKEAEEISQRIEAEDAAKKISERIQKEEQDKIAAEAVKKAKEAADKITKDWADRAAADAIRKTQESIAKKAAEDAAEAARKATRQWADQAVADAVKKTAQDAQKQMEEEITQTAESMKRTVEFMEEEKLDPTKRKASDADVLKDEMKKRRAQVAPDDFDTDEEYDTADDGMEEEKFSPEDVRRMGQQAFFGYQKPAAKPEQKDEQKPEPGRMPRDRGAFLKGLYGVRDKDKPTQKVPPPPGTVPAPPPPPPPPPRDGTAGTPPPPPPPPRDGTAGTPPPPPPPPRDGTAGTPPKAGVSVVDNKGKKVSMEVEDGEDGGDGGDEPGAKTEADGTAAPVQTEGGETAGEGADGRDDLLDPDEAKTLLREDFRWVEEDTNYFKRSERGKQGYGSTTDVQRIEPFGISVKRLPDEEKGESVFKQSDERFEPFRGLHEIVRDGIREGMKPGQESEEIVTSAMKPFAKVGGQIIWIPYYERIARFYFTSEDYSELVSNVVESGGELKLKAPPQDVISKMKGTVESVREALSVYGVKRVKLKHDGMHTQYAEWLELKQIMKALGKYQKTTTGEYNQAGLFSGNLREAVGRAIEEAVGKVGEKRKRQLGRGLEGSKRTKTADASSDEAPSYQPYNPFMVRDEAPRKVNVALPQFI